MKQIGSPMLFRPSSSAVLHTQVLTHEFLQGYCATGLETLQELLYPQQLQLPGVRAKIVTAIA